MWKLICVLFCVVIQSMSQFNQFQQYYQTPGQQEFYQVSQQTQPQPPSQPQQPIPPVQPPVQQQQPIQQMQPLQVQPSPTYGAQHYHYHTQYAQNMHNGRRENNYDESAIVAGGGGGGDYEDYSDECSRCSCAMCANNPPLCCKPLCDTCPQMQMQMPIQLPPMQAPVQPPMPAPIQAPMQAPMQVPMPPPMPMQMHPPMPAPMSPLMSKMLYIPYPYPLLVLPNITKAPTKSSTTTTSATTTTTPSPKTATSTTTTAITTTSTTALADILLRHGGDSPQYNDILGRPSFSHKRTSLIHHLKPNWLPKYGIVPIPDHLAEKLMTELRGSRFVAKRRNIKPVQMDMNMYYY